METSTELSKCNNFCNILPCMYGDDQGCSTSDPNGDVCRKKNKDAKQICKGSHFVFLHSILSKRLEVNLPNNES